MRPGDGKRGCPVEVWDGPYVMRCNLGENAGGSDPQVGECAYHGKFGQPAEDAQADRAPGRWVPLTGRPAPAEAMDRSR